MATNVSSTNFGETKKALKRVEVYLTNEDYNRLAKEAARLNRSTKNYLELLLQNKALSLKAKK